MDRRDQSRRTRSQTVGRVAVAGVEHVDAGGGGRASGAARLGGAGRRATGREFLRAAADVMRRRRFELAAWEVYECGKPWREADADVCEAIDFCEYYAAGAIELIGPHGVDVPGEENRFEYLPRGVAAVIAPWNFPLAILTGMTAAALVTGNTVVMKPAEQSSVVAAKLMEDLSPKSELPPGVLNYLPGPGETVGAALVEHPDVALIAFTGSRAVGLAINATAAAGFRHGAAQERQARDRRDGRQERDHRRRRCRSGRGGAGRGEERVRLSGPEVLGLLAGDRAGDSLRHVSGAAGRRHAQSEDRPGRGSGHERLGGDRRRMRSTASGDYIELGRKTVASWLSASTRENSPAEGFYVGPHIFADVPPGQPAGAGRDFRPGAGRGSRRRLGRSHSHRQRHRLRADRRHLFAQPGASRACRDASCWSAIFI